MKIPIYFACMQENAQKISDMLAAALATDPSAAPTTPAPRHATPAAARPPIALLILRRIAFLRAPDLALDGRIFVFTSAIAAREFARAKMRAVCVGAQTAKVLAGAGATVLCAGSDNHASSLLKQLQTRREEFAHDEFVYLRAREVAADICAQLRGFGLRAREFVVYENTPLSPPRKLYFARLQAPCAGAARALASASTPVATTTIIASTTAAAPISSAQAEQMGICCVLAISSPSLAKSAYLRLLPRLGARYAAARAPWQPVRCAALAVCIGRTSCECAKGLFVRAQLASSADFAGLVVSALNAIK